MEKNESSTEKKKSQTQRKIEYLNLKRSFHPFLIIQKEAKHKNSIIF